MRNNMTMMGTSKALAEAIKHFVDLLPQSPDLAERAEEILRLIQDEADAADRDYQRFSDPDLSEEARMAMANRRGAWTALTAERSRWRMIAARVANKPERGIDPNGYAYVQHNRE